MASKTIKVLRVRQPIGEFYIGTIKSADLIDIATVEIRRFEEGRPESIEGIQRELSKSRLKTLREYVNLDYATFPTSIIVSIDDRCVTENEIEGCDGLFELVISDYVEGDDVVIPLQESAFILDGQHRLAGLENLAPDKPDFEVNVSIFVGPDRADQAEIFSRVNMAQTKVNKSLVYDLLDYAREKSPYKVAHEITIALNNDPQGPLHRKIKRLGVKTPGVDSETLAQATVVNGLLRHLPPNQEKERTKGLFGWAGEPEPNEDWHNRIFVDFYRADDQQAIFDIVSNYFAAIARKWPNAWKEIEPGIILNRTTGYNALIRFLKDVYLSLVATPRVVTEEEFYSVFEEIKLSEDRFNNQEYLPGSTGAGDLYNDLKAFLRTEQEQE